MKFVDIGPTSLEERALSRSLLRHCVKRRLQVREEQILILAAKCRSRRQRATDIVRLSTAYRRERCGKDCSTEWDYLVIQKAVGRETGRRLWSTSNEGGQRK